MKTLLLLRHAKSDWSHRELADHDRPLAPRGRRAAPAMGRFMARAGLQPEMVLCSSALRTRETWSLLAPELHAEPPVAYDRELYLASPVDILTVLGRASPSLSSILVIGHNPGMEELALALAVAGEADRKKRERMRRKFPTAALAVFAGEARAWRGLDPEAFTLQRYVRPKDLPEAEEEGL